MTLIPRNIEQLRREGIQNAETRRQKEKDYALKVEQMSKHNVGGLYDIRAIAKSKQFKEQQSHYNTIYPAYEGISGSPQCIGKSNAYRVSRKRVCRVGRQP